jgi:hypothetical protein
VDWNRSGCLSLSVLVTENHLQSNSFSNSHCVLEWSYRYSQLCPLVFSLKRHLTHLTCMTTHNDRITIYDSFVFQVKSPLMPITQPRTMVAQNNFREGRSQFMSSCGFSTTHGGHALCIDDMGLVEHQSSITRKQAVSSVSASCLGTTTETVQATCRSREGTHC